ncbi:MAG: efflux RND transporter periplasmic adaptor subunit [Alphaproteobacteria bacterium]
MRLGGKFRLYLLIGGAVAAAAGVYGLRVATGPAADSSAPRRGAAAVAVETAPVQRGEIRDVRSFTGSLIPAARFEVAAKTGGLLEALTVDIGDTVHQGDIIARLDDAEFVQEVEQARAELRVAQASLQESRSSLESKRRAAERMRSLHRQKVAAEAELDAAEAEAGAQAARVQLAEAQVLQREAQLKAAEVRLSYTTVRALWQDGGPTRVVGERFVDEGTTISANTPIVSVLDIGNLVAVVFATERDLVRIGIGQSVMVMADPYPGETFEGRVARIAPLLRETSRQARVEVELPNPAGRLRPGMFVRAQVQLGSAEGAVIVPQTALVERNSRTGVFSVDREARQARFVPLRIGIVEGDRVQVMEPADLSGDVVTLGQHLLNDGSALVLPGSDSHTRPERTRPR